MKKVWVLVVVVVAVGVLFGMKAVNRAEPVPEQVMRVQPTKVPTAVDVPSANIYLTKTDATKGTYLTDFQGMTLYTFDKDTTGVSNCYDTCAKNWPVYTSGATAQSQFPVNISVISRTDGVKQFAWKGMPLYYFIKDTKVGDLTGDGVNDIWHIVKP